MATENYVRDGPEVVVSGTIGLLGVAVITGVDVAGFSGGGGDGAATVLVTLPNRGVIGTSARMEPVYRRRQVKTEDIAKFQTEPTTAPATEEK